MVAYDTEIGVQVTEMSAFDTSLATLGPVSGFDPAISIDGFDRYLVTYMRFNSLSGHNDIFGRRELPELSRSRHRSCEGAVAEGTAPPPPSPPGMGSAGRAAPPSAWLPRDLMADFAPAGFVGHPSTFRG